MNIRQRTMTTVKLTYPSTILVVAAIATSLCLLRAQAPAADSRSVWDGVYTEEQAKRGESVYHKEYAACNGAMLTAGESPPPLPAGALLANCNASSVGDFSARIRK